MKSPISVLMTFMLLISYAHAQSVKLDLERLEPVQASMSIQTIAGKQALRVLKDTLVKKVDEPTFVKLKGVDFHSGIIEVKVLSRLLKDAPEYARGFIGIAFRIDEQNSKYESIYIRPTNGRAQDQVRRNHSIQYYSYPDYKFDVLRKQAPEKYESYADMELNKWITLRIEVKGANAKFFIDGNSQPSLVVNDLKLEPNASGGVALWTEVGTEGFFTDLKILKQD
ncbi:MULTISPECIES: hypothetical protein [Dyadobacter]|uniref:DUF1080 domain-containing protein n=2 Tax=Dyadobacter TaxID=120831 RepID=A0A5R9KMD2_9BACT|nr:MULTISPECIES: hypothetical protein [Dyadobacter]KAA6438787.1 hypothetical protein FEM33_15820 [Dyadobacter flavalbus]TLU97380.1 hypothetical protein FEM55_00780 [Dyadobacter sediminis]